MKIGLVLSQAPAYSETFFKSKIEGLQKSGFQVVLFCQDNKTGFDGCEVKLFSKVTRYSVLQAINVFRVFLGLLPYGRRVKRWYTIEKPDNLKQFLKQVYINAPILKSNLDWLHFGFATMALQRETLAKAIGAKMAVSLRGYDIDVYPLKHNNCYTELWKYVDKVHAISNYLLGKAYGLGVSEKTSHAIITPAINTNLFNRQQTSYTDKPLQIITVARLHWIKGLLETLEALVRLKAQGVEFTYKIIGEGKMREELLFAIHQLDLHKEVVLLGKLAPKAVIEQLHNSDIYIQYSLSEGFCNAVLEAQAVGCLCVVSDGGALPENVIDGKTGWVVPKQQPKLLAEKLLEVVALPQDRQQVIQQQAGERVETHFTLGQQQAQFVKFYNE
ncbi:glycosyltransferase family 4 protein [Mangrovimonas spongiae]|uniref:Glycosyltransferase n=1 Tax=Mangrovimonas spongiae TaxID=2494697 RepID=A0A428K291_9FLAO|nr:glycosyltransferase family 4 protein [Mangrovimonas spongiae]RSK40495.1 glycosyltransferase [Mangrovimonas spongiae]